MSAVGTFLVIVLVLVVLGLAAIGFNEVVATLRDNDERARIKYRTTLAERQVEEIGRRAQDAIIFEALNRARRRDGDVQPRTGGSRPFGWGCGSTSPTRSR